MSAASITQALVCGQSSCKCHAAAKRGHGLVHCPAHDDRGPSLSVTDSGGKVLLKDHGGCSNDDVITVLRERGLWSPNGPGRRPGGLSLVELAVAKKLPSDFLRKLGVDDTTYDGRPAVAIPYFDADEKVLFTRHRISLNGDRFRQPKGISPMPYGLHLIEQIREVGEGLFVEGETDCWAAWHHELPVIGLPGKKTWRSEWAAYFQGIHMLIWQEPGAEDLARHVAADLPELEVVIAPEGIKDLSEAHVQGRNLLELISSLPRHKAPAPGEQTRPQSPPQEPPGSHTLGEVADLPEITISGSLPSMAAQALDALALANSPPHLFTRATELARVVRDDEDRPLIQALEVHALRGELARSSRWFQPGRGGKLQETLPPMPVVHDIRTWPERGEGIPPIVGIIEAPALRPDGTVIMTPGYDCATRLYLDPDPELRLPEIPMTPTPAQVMVAREAIADILHDFPFDGPASKANTVGLLLTPIVRPALDDAPAPMGLLDAPQQGTGKSLLARTLSIISTGQDAGAFTAPTDEAEWRKAITSIVIEGRSFVLIDNYEARDPVTKEPLPLRSSALSALLTTSVHRDRILGASRMVELPSRATWCASGNNIQVAGDLVRRCYRIRVDAKISRPWLRPTSGFRHSNLLEYVHKHRGELLAHLLTLCRAWFAVDCPTPPTPILGGYEAWSRTVGGILTTVRIGGFLADLDKSYDEADSETPEWEGFLIAWSEVFGDRWLTAGRIADEINGQATLTAGEQQDTKGRLRESLPSDLASAVGTKGFPQRLSKALSKRKEQRHGDDQLRLARRQDDHRKLAEWRVLCGDAT